jgi:2-methylcitrate dehydratase PrpD
MTIRQWAERLDHPEVDRTIVGLHVADTMAAFLAGRNTAEGRALAGLCRHDAAASERAAMIAGIARLTECDDIHLGSCITPGAIVVPVALALCRECGDDDFLRAVTAGYEAGITMGKAIGGAKALPVGCWPTLFAAPVMAAVTAASAKGESAETVAHAIALALAGSASRIGRPTGAPSGRWYLLAEAVGRGMHAAYAAGQGFRGDISLLTKSWLGMHAGHGDVDLRVFEDFSVGSGIHETGFKPFAAARQAVNAILAFQHLLPEIADIGRIEQVSISVPAINMALLTRSFVAGDRLSALSNLACQIAWAALRPEKLYDVARSDAPDDEVLAFAQKVSVMPDAALDAYLPHAWGAKVGITVNGIQVDRVLIRTPFDMHGGDLRQLLVAKWKNLLSPDDLTLLLRRGEADEWYAPPPLWAAAARALHGTN